MASDLPGPGMEPTSPALAGGFLTTGPPGSPLYTFLNHHHNIWLPTATIQSHSNTMEYTLSVRRESHISECYSHLYLCIYYGDFLVDGDRAF